MGGTYQDAIFWHPIIDLDRGPTLISTREGVPSGTQRDPVISFGYNQTTNGQLIVPDEGGAVWSIEGHYRAGYENEGNPGVAFMEAYLQFTLDGAYHERPFFSSFSKETGHTTLVGIGGGPNGKIHFGEADSTDIGNAPNFVFERNRMRMFARGSTPADTVWSIDQHAGRASVLQFNNSLGKPAAQITSKDGQSLFFGLDKSNSVQFRRLSGGAADVTAVGIGRPQSTAMLGISGQDGPSDISVVRLTPTDAADVATLRIDDASGIERILIDTQRGHAPAIEIRDAQGTTVWEVNKNGAITVAGRAPTTGSQQIRTVLANKPGSTGGTLQPKWFPMRDTDGNLFWIPGYPD